MENEKIKKIIFIGTLFLLFPPHLIIFGYYIKSAYISVLIPGVLGFLFFICAEKVNKFIIYTLYAILFQFVFFYLNYKFNVYNDISILIKHYQGLTCFFAAFFYIYIISKNDISSFLYNNNIIIKYIIYATLINSIILLLTKFSPNFKEIFYQYVGITDLAYQYIFKFKEIGRYQGLVHSGFSFLSSLYGLVISLNLLMLYKNFNCRPLLISLIINFIALLDIGRSGYLPILITITYLIFDFKYNGNKISTKYLYKFFILLLIFILYASFAYPKLSWIIEPFNIFRYDSGTIGNLLNHQYTFPDNIFFGNGNFGFNQNFPALVTDSGFEIFLNASGILGYLISFFLFIPIIFYWRNKSFNLILKVASIVIFLSLVILNFKDYYYYGYGDIFQIYFLIIISTLLSDQEFKNPFYYRNIFKFAFK
jgi:hypothetical protein